MNEGDYVIEDERSIKDRKTGKEEEDIDIGEEGDDAPAKRRLHSGE